MVKRGLPRPILVGGAAVEYYSAGTVATGDFDPCTPRCSPSVRKNYSVLAS